MKLYLYAGRYYGTQAETKAAMRNAGDKGPPADHEVDVPVNKAELITYLNNLASDPAETNQNQDDLASVMGAEPIRHVSLGTATQIMDRMDRGHAENALKEAQAAIAKGLQLIRRPHSDAGAASSGRFTGSVEGSTDDGPLAGDEPFDPMA